MVKNNVWIFEYEDGIYLNIKYYNEYKILKPQFKASKWVSCRHTIVLTYYEYVEKYVIKFKDKVCVIFF